MHGLARDKLAKPLQAGLL